MRGDRLACLLFATLASIGPVPAVAQSTLFICETHRAYSNEAGELKPYREQAELLSWSNVVFDSRTGLLRYGQDGRRGIPPRWTEARLTVVSGQEPVAGYYLHNGTILSVIEIKTWVTPMTFIWLRGGNSDVLTGTCKGMG